MSRFRCQYLLCVSSALIALGGCRASPWSRPDVVGHSPAAETHSAAVPTLGLPGTGQPAVGELQQVMGEVRRLGAQDPTLQAQLLAELQAAEPSLWPLVLESFRSRVAYARQLRRKEALAARAVEPYPALAQDWQAGSLSRTEAEPERAGPHVARLPATDRAILPPTPSGPTQTHPAPTDPSPAVNEPTPTQPEEELSPSSNVHWPQQPVVPISYDAEDPSDDWREPLARAITRLETERTPESKKRLNRLRRQLSEVSARLSEAAPLGVRNLAFCRAVHSYGSIEPFEEFRFRPGQRVLLYAEVENFRTDPTPRGYHTALESRYEIFDSTGTRVARQESTTTEEHCLNRRRDYFIGCDFRLPKQLTAGEHSLKLTVEDLKTGKVAAASIPFTVE